MSNVQIQAPKRSKALDFIVNGGVIVLSMFLGASMPGINVFVATLGWAIVFMIYLLPTYVALGRCHHSAAAIFVLNLFLGFTFLGWVIALIWACTRVGPDPIVVNVVNENKVGTP